MTRKLVQTRFRFLAALVATLLLLTFALPVCAQASGEAPMPVRYYMPGTGSNIKQDVIDLVNEKMQADGYNLELQPLYIPWDSWVDKINVMISSGEEFELFHIMADFVPYTVYNGRGALMELDAVIDQYAPELRKVFNEDAWKCAQVDGKTLAIPDEWRDNSGDLYGQFHIRADKLEAAGIEIPEDFDMATLMDKLEQLQANWGGSVVPYVWDHSLTRPPIPFHRFYDSYPFFVSMNGVFYVNQEGQAKAYFETEEFAKDSAIYAEMYKRGLIHPDVLSVPQDTQNSLKQDGDVLAGIDTFTMESQATLRQKYPEATIAIYRPLKDKPATQDTPVLNMNAVPITCRNPQAAVMFLDWLYKAEENHDLLVYGVEGTHYENLGGGTIRTAFDPDTKQPIHRFDQWMIANLRYLKFEEGTPQEVIDDWKGVTNPIQKLATTGFSFDPEPVSVEYAQVSAEYNTVILPIKMGVADYDTNIDAAITAMKQAGIDAVIAEYQRQLDAFNGKG